MRVSGWPGPVALSPGAARFRGLLEGVGPILVPSWGRSVMGARAIALFDVSTAQGELLRAQDHRRRCFTAAREQGASWAAIGDAAGLTEAGARAVVKRAEGRVSA